MLSKNSLVGARTSLPKQYRLPRLSRQDNFETTELLRACIPAHRALGAYAQCCQQSRVSAAAQDVFACLNAAAALQLGGTLISLRNLLSMPIAHRQEAISRYVLQANGAASRLGSEPVGSVLAQDLASELSGQPVTIRRVEQSEKLTRIDECPPIGAERLQSLLENWQTFIQQDAQSLDSMLVVGIAHGQWIAMQPFTQANTATAQLLTSLLLVEEGLVSTPSFPLIHTFARRSDNYWTHLNEAISGGKRDAWLRYFLNEVESSALYATNLMMAWQQHLDLLTERLPELLPKLPSDALIRLCGMPSFGISDLADVGISRRQTATAWMQRLVDAGILKEGKVGKEKRYTNPIVQNLILNIEY